jgi:hypothetical protein
MEDKLRCPRCDASRTPGEVDFGSVPARCRICGAAVEVENVRAEAGEKPKSRHVAAPVNFQVEVYGGALQIAYQWLDAFIYVVALVLLVWADLMLIGFFLLWLPSLALPAGLILVGVGAVLLYRIVAGHLNRTIVTAGGGSLVIWHGPLPWLRGRLIDAGHIDQLYVKREGQPQDRKRTIGFGRGYLGKVSSNTHDYQLRAIFRNGEDVRLLGRLGTLQEALFLEQAVEEHLGIVDRPVEGSIPR